MISVPPSASPRLRHFSTLLNAYRSDAMQYVCIGAERA